MTTTTVTHVQDLAQEAFEFVSARLPDNVGPMWAILKSFNLDRSVYRELEIAIGRTVSDAEYSAFIAGFTISRALENVPLFAASGD